jgi:hypothetical protein
MTQLSGASVIQNFQTVFYATVGFVGQQALLISGVYGLMGVIGLVFYLIFIADKWPRKATLWSGSLVLCAMMATCTALSAVYGSRDNNNDAGARTVIAFIFIYSAAYAAFFNGIIWVVSSEMLPFFLRYKGMAVAIFIKGIVASVISQITSIAVTSISWR